MARGPAVFSLVSNRKANSRQSGKEAAVLRVLRGGFPWPHESSVQGYPAQGCSRGWNGVWCDRRIHRSGLTQSVDASGLEGLAALGGWRAERTAGGPPMRALLSAGARAPVGGEGAGAGGGFRHFCLLTAAVSRIRVEGECPRFSRARRAGGGRFADAAAFARGRAALFTARGAAAPNGAVAPLGGRGRVHGVTHNAMRYRAGRVMSGLVRAR